jgi:hypothetical protein
MRTSPKTEHLRALNEDALRRSLLIPLLEKMGFKGVREYHGPSERGKDIVCYDCNKLGQKEYFAIVAKAVDLNADVSSPSCLQEVVRQVQQCFDVPYADLFGMNKVTMDRVWVVTSRKVTPGAEDSVIDSLKKSNLSKLVTIVPGERLQDLLDEHYPSYWDESLDSSDILTEQKYRLMAFVERLLVTLGGNPEKVGATIGQIVGSSTIPVVSGHPDGFLWSVGAYHVDLDTIDNEYSHDFYTEKGEHCGLVREAYFRAKKLMEHAMLSVYDIICKYDSVVKKTNPWDLVKAFDSELDGEYGFTRESGWHDDDPVRAMEDLSLVLTEIDKLRANLTKLGRLDWATTLVDSVRDLKPEVESFLAQVERENFTLSWRIETTEENGGRVSWWHDPERPTSLPVFSTEHRRTMEEWRRGRTISRTITPQDVLEQVRVQVRRYLDSLLVEAGILEQED